MFKKILGAVVLSASMVACSDMTGPGDGRMLVPAEASQAKSVKDPIIVAPTTSDTMSQVITIDGGASKTYYFGGHSLYVQANSVCKTAVSNGSCSTYGSRETVKVTMKWWTNSLGQPVISVSPVLYFRADRPAQLNVAAPVQGSSGPVESMMSAPEGTSDLSMLLTMFSGYNVWA